MRLRGVELDQEHRARHADCEAQLVRVRSELSRLRHSYEQLRAKRSSQQKLVTAGSGGHGTTNYRQECHCLRSQLAGAKEKEREMEKECRELRERLKKREEEMERVEVERRQSQQSVSHLQETVRSKDGLIRYGGLAKLAVGGSIRKTMLIQGPGEESGCGQSVR